MTTNLFDHNTVTVNSSISPVENLASEVSEAFTKLEKIIQADNILPSFSKIIGEYLLTSVNFHGVEEEFTETFSLLKDVDNNDTGHNKDFVLESEVIDGGLISVSYLRYGTTNDIVYLTIRDSNQTFTDTNQCKVKGRVVSVSGSLPTESLKIVYRGKKKEFGDLKLRPNVLIDANSQYLLSLEHVSGLEYSVDYSFDLSSNTIKYFGTTNLDKDNIFILISTLDGYKVLEYTDVTVQGSKLIFTLTEELDDDYVGVVFINNITMSDFINSFYKEFTTHAHRSNSLEGVISHSSLKDRFKNNNLIYFKDVDTVNYEHPQFLNREGYNASVPEVFKNAMLGDLVLSAKLTSVASNTEYESINRDSNSLVFNNITQGSRIFFDESKKALVLLSGAGLHGLDIVVGYDIISNTAKKAISINQDSYLSEVDELQIRGKNNTVHVVSDDPLEKSLLKVDNLISEELTTENVVTDELKIGNNTFKNVGLNLEVSKLDINLDTKIHVKVPSHFDTISANSFNTDRLILEDGDQIYIDDDNYISKGEVGFKVITDAFKIFSSGRNSGLFLGLNKDLTSNFYTADYAGNQATPNDTEMYLESPPSSDFYFLKSTNDKILYGDKEYVFGTTEQNTIRVNSLKDWWRAKVFVGDVDADYIAVKPIDKVKKHGLQIGKTRISSMGEGLTCPEGLTIIESLSSVHVINPLPENELRCNDLSYQSLNTGDLQVFGSTNIQSSLYVVENATIGDRLTTNLLTVDESLTTIDLTVRGNTLLTGASTLNGFVTVNNKLSVTGEVNISGSMTSYDLTTQNFLRVRGTLTVDGQSIFNNNIIVDGSINTAGGFSTTGPVDCSTLRTGSITCEDIRSVGGIVSDGEVRLTGPFIVNGSFNMLGNTLIQGTLETSSELTAKSLYVTTNAVIDGRLTVLSTALFNNSVNVDGKVSAQEGFYTPNLLEANQIRSVEIVGTEIKVTSMEVNGNLLVSGSAEMRSGLNIKGNANIDGSVTIINDVTLRSLNVTNNIDILNRLTVTGPVILESSSVIIGKLNASVTLRGSIQIESDLLTLAGSLQVFTNLSVNNNVDVNGILDVSGNITATSASFNSGVEVRGKFTASVAEFGNRAVFQEGLRSARDIETNSIKSSNSDLGKSMATEIYVSDKLSMGAGSVASVESLETSGLTQKGSSKNSTFEGTAEFKNKVAFRKTLIIGDDAIAFSSDVKGIYIKDDSIQLGIESTVSADQITAKAGIIPVINAGETSSGSSNAKMGYTFDGLSGTGLYGASDSPMHPNTSLNLFVDSQLAGFVSNETVRIPAKDPLTGEMFIEGSEEKYDNHLIRLKELKESRLSILEETKPIPINMLNLIYPVGTIYSNGNDPRDPKEIFEWPESSWRRYGPGRSIMAATGAGAPTSPWLSVPSDLRAVLDTAGEVFGDYSHRLIMEEMPADNSSRMQTVAGEHAARRHGGGGFGYASGGNDSQYAEDPKHPGGKGGDKPHNNTHPVIITHVWIREA